LGTISAATPSACGGRILVSLLLLKATCDNPGSDNHDQYNSYNAPFV